MCFHMPHRKRLFYYAGRPIPKFVSLVFFLQQGANIKPNLTYHHRPESPAQHFINIGSMSRVYAASRDIHQGQVACPMNDTGP